VVRAGRDDGQQFLFLANFVVVMLWLAMIEPLFLNFGCSRLLQHVVPYIVVELAGKRSNTTQPERAMSIALIAPLLLMFFASNSHSPFRCPASGGKPGDTQTSQRARARAPNWPRLHDE
jgi:hypothetical protein